ncbi:MAG: manganese efflux pump [Acidobacteria bacterium]|nr:MAG: manganese efflux pump [Acidobacteriota bacterium]
MASGSLMLIAVGLSMDALAVSASNGMINRHSKVLHAVVLAVFFGSFQGLMALAGWSVGSLAHDLVAAIDHWIAFLLLAAIAGKMIYESFGGEEPTSCSGTLTLCTVLALSVATSIDALAVGVGLSFLDLSILDPVVIIGLTTFFLTLVGAGLGHLLGKMVGRRFELLGGLILLAIGLKILLEHTLAASA